MFSYFCALLRLSRMSALRNTFKDRLLPRKTHFMCLRLTRSLLLHHLNLKHIDRLHVGQQNTAVLGCPGSARHTAECQYMEMPHAWPWGRPAPALCRSQGIPHLMPPVAPWVQAVHNRLPVFGLLMNRSPPDRLCQIPLCLSSFARIQLNRPPHNGPWPFSRSPHILAL